MAAAGEKAVSVAVEPSEEREVVAKVEAEEVVVVVVARKGCGSLQNYSW
jgi:fructose-1,6-bisphosphatase/sedoheptulose 1,7-bisphosphatase-like protein